MKITIKKTIEETHELELPAYRKNICYYYKIISEEKAIQVCFAKNMEHIGVVGIRVALASETVGHSEQFEDYFYNVIQTLKDKV